MVEDRRAEPRLRLEQCVKVSFGQEIFIGAEAVNISRKGMLCDTSAPVDNLERIFFMINLPFVGETRTIKCEGIVLYTHVEGEHTRFGVQFIDMQEADAGTLERYLGQVATA